MSFIKKFNGKIISLGSNCFIKLFLNDINYKEETYFFDYIGTSMWSINELIENNFNDLFNKDKFEKKQILFLGKDKYIYQYYLRFKHDVKQNFNSCENDITKQDLIGPVSCLSSILNILLDLSYLLHRPKRKMRQKHNKK